MAYRNGNGGSGGQKKKFGAVVDGKLTFGKYNGTPLKEVPTDYLEWIVNVREEDLTVLKTELDTREDKSD